MVIIPIYASIAPSIVGAKIVRRRSLNVALRQRAITINDKTQIKILPHKAPRDELAAMGYSSVLDFSQKCVNGLEQIISMTNRILLDLNKKQKNSLLNKIENEINTLEVLYGEIPSK